MSKQQKFKEIFEKQKLGNNSELYHKTLIERQISIPFTSVNKNIYPVFNRYISKHFEGKCSKEGYIKRGATNIQSFTAGDIKGSNVLYHVILSAYVCFPHEDMEVNCVIESVTKIGIKAIIDKRKSNGYIHQREHNPNVDMNNYNEGDKIKARIIGHRFEINDEFISVLAEIID